MLFRSALKGLKSRGVSAVTTTPTVVIRSSPLSISCSIATKEGYKSFGSFHSDNVEILIRQDSDTYAKPKLPRVVQKKYNELLRSVSDNQCQFGKESKKLFMLDDQFIFLNHGAFGLTLKIINEYGNAWREYCESQPLRFFDRDLLPHLVYSYRTFGKFINCIPENLVLIPNATYGINSIVRSVIKTKEDHVLLLNVSYGAVKKIVETVCKDNGSSFDVVDIPLNTSSCSKSDTKLESKEIGNNYGACRKFEENILSLLEKTVKPKHKLIIFDHTTSNTGLNLPIERMTKVCKKYGAKVAIDGAHGLLAQRIDMNDLFNNHRIDFYVGNCHKWLCSSKGLGFMCVNKQIVDDNNDRELLGTEPEIVPRVISHGYGDGFISNYMWDGCRDYSSALTLPLLLKFWELYDLDSIREYQHNTLKDSVELLVNMWYGNGTSASSPPLSLNNIDCSKTNVNMIAPFCFHSPMVLIKLPDKFQAVNPIDKMYCNTSTDAKKIQDYLYYEKKIEAPIKNIDSVLYCRLSCHIYNEINDYETFGKAFL
eukprot:g8939.t1